MTAYDPLHMLIKGHESVSEWIENLWNAVGVAEAASIEDVDLVIRFFGQHVREHFLYEEMQLFPVLLRVDPDPATGKLVERLRLEHVAILSGCSALMGNLAWCMTAPDPVARIGAFRAEARGLIDLVLAHAAYEDEHLLPRVMLNRAAILAHSEQARDGVGA